ncbi:MAG: hypothetical protein M3037_02825 [Gemmatimonadota bacterium]|nr:hypothetical protein [Gemmatimonadota bacterium]
MDATVCIANIGPEERRKRLTFGIAMLAASIVISFLFVFYGVRPAFRVILFVPIFVGALGFFQARDRTCVKLASRGQRDMDTGLQQIADKAEADQIRRQAQAVYVKALISATILTALALIQ